MKTGHQWPGKQLFRLEIHGRPGWFVPAGEWRFPRDISDEEAQRQLAKALAEKGPVYTANAKVGEYYHLMRIPDDGLWHPSFEVK